MLHVRAAEEIPPTELAVPARWVFPACPIHADSLVRPYRTLGPEGPGAYPQCVPRGSDRPHLLAWHQPSGPPAKMVQASALSPSELDVLRDAAQGLTVVESAASRIKSPETVKSQRKQVMVKLGARNMTHAVALAAAECFIELERAA
jgi:DNA-binding CsgD family transcriptional regulator